MVPVALSFGVLQATGDAGALGLVLAAGTAPMVLLLLGGVVADRTPRGALLIWTHVAAALAQALSACWFLLQWRSVGLLAGSAALGGVASAFTGPALRGLLTDLVPAPALGRAVASRTTARNVFRLTGPGVSGVIVVLAGAGPVLALDAACLLGAALLFRGLPATPASARTGERRGLAAVWEELVDGIREVVSRSWLWLISMSFFVINMMIGGIWLVMGPLSLSHSGGPIGWGAVLGARACGQLLGAALAYRWRVRHPLVWVLLGSVPYTAAFIGIGTGAPVLALVVLAAVAGVFSAVGDVTWETVLAHQIPSRAISRVSSVDMMLSFCSVPLGQILAPPAVHLWGLAPVALAGTAVCVLALVAPLASRPVRTMTAA